jgi:hypothetical protein
MSVCERKGRGQGMFLWVKLKIGQDCKEFFFKAACPDLVLRSKVI